MMNVAMWNKKIGDWMRIEGAIKLERFRTAWALYFEDGSVREYKRSIYELISVDTY